MASTINAQVTPIAGVITTADTSGALSLQTGGTTALTIDTSQNVGIGTASPATKLNIKNASGNTTFRIDNSTTTFDMAVFGDNTCALEAGNSQPILFFTSGSERMRIDSSGNVGIGLTPVSANGILQLGSYSSIKALLETATITAAAPSATTNFDAITQAVQYYTSNAANNWTLNVRGNSSTTLNSIMAVGQSITVAVITTQGATPYYASALTIDGNAVTPKYQGGTAWTSGNASGLDAYTYTIIKTASATFTVLAAQTQYK